MMGKKRGWEKPVQPTRQFESFGFLPFEPIPKKRLDCPRCGKVGELTGKRNAEGLNIYRCRLCKIEYSQHLKKGFCAFGVTEKNGKHLTLKKTKEPVFVRPILPSDCRQCPLYAKFIAVKLPCPHFMGLIGRELDPPEQWDKA